LGPGEPAAPLALTPNGVAVEGTITLDRPRAAGVKCVQIRISVSSGRAANTNPIGLVRRIGRHPSYAGGFVSLCTC